MDIRPCPHCGSPPARVYPPRTYVYGGKTKVVEMSYCSNCVVVFQSKLKGPPKRIESRTCPRCGRSPDEVYAPKLYGWGRGEKKLRQSAYCRNCQKTFWMPSSGGVFTEPFKAPKPLRHDQYTLEMVLADPGPWMDCVDADGTRVNGRWRHLRLLILERDGWMCQAKGPRCKGQAKTVDHIIPVSEGGNSHPNNLRAACGPCNFGTAAIDYRDHICRQCGAINSMTSIRKVHHGV